MAIRAEETDGKGISLDSWKALASKSEAPKGATLRKGYIPDEIKEVEGADRTLRFRISTGSVDRDRDTIAPAGWKLSNYKKNPIVLWAHDYSSLPIARTTKIKVDGDALVATAEFADHPFADTVYRMLKGGFLKATSVGFEPLKHAYDDKRGGYDFLEQELLEFSVVPVPANPEALMEASLKGIDVGPVREWAKAVLAAGEKPLVIPPQDGTCPAGYAMGEDGQCHEKSAEAVAKEELVACVKAEVAGVAPLIEEAVRKAVLATRKPEDDDHDDCPLGAQCPMGKAAKDQPWRNVFAEHKQDGFEIQSVLFPKAKWESDAACRAWLREHDFKGSDLDEIGDHYRFRQPDPGDFQRIRTICLAPGRDTPMEDCRVKGVGGPLKAAEDFAVKLTDGDVIVEIEGNGHEDRYEVSDEDLIRAAGVALDATVQRAVGPAVRSAVMSLTGRVD